MFRNMKMLKVNHSDHNTTAIISSILLIETSNIFLQIFLSPPLLPFATWNSVPSQLKHQSPKPIHSHSQIGFFQTWLPISSVHIWTFDY